MSVNKPAFTNGMETKIRAIREAENTVARVMKQIGPSEAIDRFVSRYAKVRTQKAYLTNLQVYLRWLKGEGVNFTPDPSSKPTKIAGSNRLAIQWCQDG